MSQEIETKVKGWMFRSSKTEFVFFHFVAKQIICIQSEGMDALSLAPSIYLLICGKIPTLSFFSTPIFLLIS
jgi:hypothetical protein